MVISVITVTFLGTSCNEYDAEIVPPAINTAIESPADESNICVFVSEERAEPVGGITSFYGYVQKNLRYPEKRICVGGKVFVEFIVNTDGSISDVRTVRGIHPGFDEEAERVVRRAPRWNPAKIAGQAVRQRMIMPVSFEFD